MKNADFIDKHRADDVHLLALQKPPQGVDLKYCLQQIEGWQMAKRKLPRWAEHKEILFPPRVSLEQCSSETTALYKRQLVERLLPDEASRAKMADFTGGFGVDFSYMAPLFTESLYVERQDVLCQTAHHNFGILGLSNAQILCAETTEDSFFLREPFSFVFLDPARRDSLGRKTVLIEDCTPNVAALQDLLLRAAPLVMLKLSPMLDITSALRVLKDVREVHVVSIENECKELLLVMGQGSGLSYHCVNLGSPEPPFIIDAENGEIAKNAHFIDGIPTSGYLFEPNVSILKAGVQNALCNCFPLQKLHPMSHLFYSPAPVDAFPGRCFRLLGWSDFSKRSLRQLLGDLRQSNLTLRNFPSTTADLRKRLGLREGGDTYLFATTLRNGSHALMRCERLYCSGTTA